MKKRVWLIISLFCMAAHSMLWGAASDPLAVFEAANQHYQAGEYKQAIEAYRTLLPAHQSANLHYNLGNAYYQLGDYGPAVLHYEKALALDPRNPDIRTNLQLTQEAAQLTPPPPSWTSVVANLAPVNTWAWLAVISFWATLALFLLAPLYRWKGPARGGITALALLLLVASGIALYGWHVQARQGVVLSDDAKLSVAPTESSPPVGTVKAGQLAQIRQRHGDYYLITLDDKVGWLPQDSFTPIWDP